MTKWIEGQVIQVERWTDRLFSLTIQAPVNAFIAGQFTKLALKINGKYVQRAYSYLNAPSSNPYLEFYLVTVSGGQLTPMLNQLRPGLSIMIAKESTGHFVLDEVPDCQILWMLATGTAIGPFLSILQEGAGLDRFQQLVLVHATRYSHDLSYLPLMQILQQRYDVKLRIQTIVSREIGIHSLTGRIPSLIKDGQLEAAVGLTIDANTSHLMLCGNPQMVWETQKILQMKYCMRKHLRRQVGHITCEQYW